MIMENIITAVFIMEGAVAGFFITFYLDGFVKNIKEKARERAKRAYFSGKSADECYLVSNPTGGKFTIVARVWVLRESTTEDAIFVPMDLIDDGTVQRHKINLNQR